MYVVVGVVVGVFVADSVAQFFVASVVCVLEMGRDCGFCVFDGVHGSEDGVDLGEFCTGSVGDYFCQGGLAGSGRAVEDDGGQFVSFDSPV